MEQLLRDGLASLGLSEDAVPSLLRYGELLLEKNRVMNLTAITEPSAVASLHFLDSAALLTMADFSGKRVADIGTGAGFPGIPLKLLEPSMELTLLDALGKRVEFLREVCADLQLSGVTCVHARAEEFAAENREAFDLVTSRAVANLRMLCELCLPLVRVNGSFLAMKAVGSDEELREAAGAISLLGGRVERTVEYPVFGAGVAHRVILIQKIRETPKKYPRIFAKIKKNPL